MTYDNCRDSILEFWSCCDSVDLSNYYTKQEVDDLIETSGSVSPDEVQQMIDESTSGLTAQVQQNAQDILNRYTKEETNTLLEAYLTKLKANEMIANYARVEGTELILNNQNIEI